VNLIPAGREAVADGGREVVVEVVDDGGGELGFADGVSGLDADAVLDRLPGLPVLKFTLRQLARLVSLALVLLAEGEDVGVEYFSLAGVTGRTGPGGPAQPLLYVREWGRIASGRTAPSAGGGAQSRLEPGALAGAEPEARASSSGSESLLTSMFRLPVIS
jgi:hypothetical protein